MFKDRDDVFYPIAIVDNDDTKIKFSYQPIVKNTNLQRYFGGSKIDVIQPSSSNIPIQKKPTLLGFSTQPKKTESKEEEEEEEEEKEEEEKKQFPADPQEAAKVTSGGYKRYLPRKTPRILQKQRNKTKRFLY